jgi:hypothetical protein
MNEDKPLRFLRQMMQERSDQGPAAQRGGRDDEPTRSLPRSIPIQRRGLA